MNNRFLFALIAVIVVLGGIFWFTNGGNKANAPTKAAEVSNHTKGEGKKGVTLIEYGDFECPACGAYFPLVKQIEQKYGDDITLQFRNFPLTQLHPNAFAAHRAAEAANKQGKFWEMHDMLYQGQPTWTSTRGVSQASAITAFEGYARQLGLDIEQYKKDFASSEINDIINTDVKAGQALKISSTPTFILNGRKIEENPRDEAAFFKLIDDEIAKSSR